jgi:hypothetical protein
MAGLRERRAGAGLQRLRPGILFLRQSEQPLAVLGRAEAARQAARLGGHGAKPRCFIFLQD